MAESKDTLDETRIRILVVEPSTHLHPVIKQRLGDGFEVIGVTSSGESFRRLARGENYDVVAAAACTNIGPYFEQVCKLLPRAKRVLISGFPSPPAGCSVDATVLKPVFSGLRETVESLFGAD